MNSYVNAIKGSVLKRTRNIFRNNEQELIRANKDQMEDVSNISDFICLRASIADVYERICKLIGRSRLSNLGAAVD